ncbi:putative uncharacterized protein DDB_G0286901 [Tetranychus urticae]|uniref:putative uncharacterized protein DDB_G0286901 n=1 Tax=Tetranychus urticae TaxID=32264 RepID=UPI000D642DC2|nr:putative uncharacterized protein DDB_G0286901 [Tetranychus urticae]
MWRNGKRFPCPDCHKTFATQVDLKAHLMRHITQHPYVCFACGKGFKYDHTLDFHIKSQHGAENGTGNTSTGSSGKNESFNLKSLNRKSCKMKREMVDDKSGSSVISGVGLFGIGSGTGTVSGSGSGAGSGIGTGTGLDNQNNNRALNNSSSIGERNKQQRRDQPLIGRLREMDDPIGNTNVKHNKNNKARENCDDQSFNGGISSDIISQHHQLHNQHNQPQHVLTNNPLQIPGSLIEPNSILNGLKFPISLSSYPSCTTTASHTSTLNSIPFVPTTLLPSSGSTLTSSLPSSVSSPSLIPSLASSLLTSSTNLTSTTTSTATIAATKTPTTTSTANKDKMSSIVANTSNLASNLPLIDFGLQGDLSPRNLQIKSEKVLISVLEGVHPVNEQTYSLYKCCLCGFAFPSLEPVSIHIQSLHSNNLNLTCDKCGATFKWKSELQLHEQLHKAMDQSVNNFILNNGEEIDSNNNNNNNSNSNGNNINNNIKNQNNVNNIKSKSQLQNHHSLQNQLKQDHNHPHLQKQLQLQLQQLQQHQHQQQSQQSSRSLIMPSFLQPNLVFMNQYLNSDDHKIGNDNDDIRRRSNIGIKEEDEGNEGIQEDADEESKCDQDENIDEDDGQGLNLSLKPQYKTKFEDVNPSYDKNNSMMMSMMMMRNKNNNMKLNNNINNENDENNNNGHDRMTSMDEPIDLKIESFSDSNNNNINNLGNNIISNSLNFLHSSLLPSSMGLSFPPMPSSASSSTSISTSAAQASAAAAAAAVFAKNIAPKQSQLHQQNIGGLNSFQLQNIGPSNVSRSISSPSSSSLSTGTISSVSSSGGATLNSGNVNVNGIGNIGMGKITEPIGDIEETAPGQFKCRFCDKTFDRIFSVHRHERVHTGYKPCICKECGRGFSEKRNLRHHTIRFHSDGSGRELLKRNRKEKSMASAASFLKKAAVRLLSNSSVEGSAMEEDDIMSNRLTSDNNNNNINININSNNNNNGDDGKNDMKNCSSNYNYKNNDNTDGSKDDEFDQRSRISDDISGNTDNYNSTFNCNDKDDNNNNNNNGDDADDVNHYNNYHHKQMNMKRMNRKNINNNNICDNKEMGSDANGDSNIEDNIGDKICLNSSSLSSSSSLSLSLSLSSP